MIRESGVVRLMRFYARWRATVFVALTLLAVYFGVREYVPGYYDEGGVLVPRKWSEDSRHESDFGSWSRMLFGVRGAREPFGDVVIVGFDKAFDAESYRSELPVNEPLRKYVEAKGTAFDRAVYAHVLDKLVAEGARMVVFDFFFEGKGDSDSGDQALADAILRHRDKVVIGCRFSSAERRTGEENSGFNFALVDPYEKLIPDERPSEVMGFVDVWPDANGTMSTMKSAESQLTMARPSLSDRVTEWEYSLSARAAKKLGVAVPEDNRSRIINYAGPWKTIPTYPVIDLLAAKEWETLSKSKIFKDKVVVVGPYSEIHYKDAFITPYGMMLGVEIQANSLRNFLHRDWIVRALPSKAWCAVFTAALCLWVFLMTVLVRTRRGGARVLMSLGGPVVYFIVAHLAFSFGGFFFPVIPLYCAGALGAVFVVFDFIHAQYEKSRITGMFGTYLSPAIVRRMVASGEEPKLGGEQVALTAFFSDVQSFSSFSEILTPEQLVEIMNEYLGAMTEILEEDAGTLDKYIGDAIVAMFGAPIRLQDHAHRACACALRMQKRLGELRGKWASQGDRWPKKIHAMRMRIGLNSGAATVGNMGSAKRFNYTMMGDTVNLAARCESGAKSAGVYTLVSGETAEAARKAPGDEILFRKIDLWRVKGRSTAVTMYEVVDFMDAVSAETKECVRLYEAALELYFGRKFTEALELFEKARALEPLQPGRDPGVEHTPSEIMAVRCGEMLAAPPPADWDGVYVMKSK